MTLQAICRNCGKTPEPGSPLGLCSPCLMARLIERPPSVAPQAGEGFEALRQLAKGGMGTVMEARDLSLHRTVAMKVLHQTSARQAHSRFNREALVLARLAHPNIVPIHSMGRDADGRPFYTMKLVRGVTLQAVLDELRKGSEPTLKRYPLTELLGIFLKVGQAVAFAHSCGVIHRDLKPENIMVGEFGEVLVMDWGLAKVAGEVRSPADETKLGVREFGDEGAPGHAGELTFDGAVLGTPQFMSPEQASGRITEMDTRSDIFSLGAILYAILTLRPPVRGRNLREVLAKVRSGDIEPPAHYNAADDPPTEHNVSVDESSAQLRKTHGLPHCPDGRVPEALSAVTMRAMALQAGNRYQTVLELLADVEAYLGGFSTSVEDVGVLGQLWLLMRRHRVVSALLVVMLLLTAGFVAKVIASESKARKALAESRIALADSALRDRDVIQMRHHLDAVSSEHRNEDWRYLHRSLRSSLGAITGTKGGPFDQVFGVPGETGEFVASDLLGNVLVINATTRSAVRMIATGLSGHLQISISSDASRVAVTKLGSREVRLFDYKSGELQQRVSAPGGPIDWIGFPARTVDRLFVIEKSPLIGRMMDIKDGHSLWEMRAGVEAAFDPTGRFIAFPVLSLNQDVRLVNSQTGQSVRMMDAGGERTYIWRLEFSPDGTSLAGGDHLGDVHVWEVTTGRLLRRFNAGVGRLQGLAFGPEDSLITICEEGREDASARRSLRVWNWRHGAELASFIGLGSRESSFGFDAKSGVLVTTGPELNCYRVPVGRHRLGFPASSPGRFTRFLGESNLVAATDGSFVGTYSLATPQPPKEDWAAPTKQFVPAVAGDAQTALVCGFAEPNFQSYQLARNAAGQFKPARQFNLPIPVGALDLNRDGTVALLAGKAGGVHLYNISQGRLENLFQVARTNSLKLVRFCQHEQGAVTLSSALREADHASDVLALWSIPQRRLITAVTNHFVCNAIDLDVGQKRIALVGEDLMVRIHDAATLKIEQQFRAHNKNINAVAFHPSLPVLATASDDLSVKLWDLRTGEMIDYYIGPARPPLSLSFSPSGKLLAAGCADKTTRVWNVTGIDRSAGVAK